MRTVLVWKAKDSHAREVTLAPENVGQALQERFSPLFKKPPSTELLSAGDIRVAVLRLPVVGWSPPFLEEEGGEFAFAVDYPLNLGQVLDASERGERPLVSLGRRLERDPDPLLRELAPPFSMVWSHGDELFLQTDGLGQGHWFEYEDDRVWAVTNRVGALATLGVSLEPVPEEWAVRFTLGWFTADKTGYRGVRLCDPGTQLRVGRSGVRRSTTDVLGEWVHPPAMSREECRELARTSFDALLREAALTWDNASVGLSGGRDSRAVASILRTMDVTYELRVRGHPGRLDVMIANQLARMADLPIRIKTKGGVPPEAEEDCRACIERALLWQGGHMTMLKHKTFLAKRGVMDGGVINVMGQHSGTGKADFAVRIQADTLEPEQYEDALVDSLMKDALPSLREDLIGHVRDEIRAAYRKAHEYDLEGLHPLHFFFLYEYTRRWGAATINAQNGMVVSPFLNPGFIRAAYAYPPEELPRKPFHGHITGHYAPDWEAYPYEDQITYEQIKSGNCPVPPADVKLVEEKDLPVWRRGKRWNKYNHPRYWEMAASGLVSEAMTEGGLWRDIFDVQATEQHWNRTKGVADAVVICHLLPRE